MKNLLQKAFEAGYRCGYERSPYEIPPFEHPDFETWYEQLQQHSGDDPKNKKEVDRISWWNHEKNKETFSFYEALALKKKNEAGH